MYFGYLGTFNEQITVERQNREECWFGFQTAKKAKRPKLERLSSDFGRPTSLDCFR